VRAKARAKSMRPKTGRKTRDALDALVDAAADALGVHLEPAWKSAVKANLATTFALTALFADFPLPDDAEPAPIFSA
jgi:Protein of unknown function (DUF4089)